MNRVHTMNTNDFEVGSVGTRAVNTAQVGRRSKPAATGILLSSQPVTSIIRLYRSPLAKLAWIFGFGR
jgi:hypothetical protein